MNADLLENWLKGNDQFFDLFCDIVSNLGKQSLAASPLVVLRDAKELFRQKSDVPQDTLETAAGRLVFSSQIQEQNIQRASLAHTDIDQLERSKMAEILNSIEQFSANVENLKQEINSIPGLFDSTNSRLEKLKQLQGEQCTVKAHYDLNSEHILKLKN